MDYLQLSEGVYLSSDEFALAQGYEFDLAADEFALAEDEFSLSQDDPMAPYVFIPDDDGGKYIHMEILSDLPTTQFEALLDAVEPYQPNLMAEDEIYGLSAGRRRQWKDQKRAQRQARKEAKTANIQARAGIKQAKAAGIEGGYFGRARERTGKPFGGGRQGEQAGRDFVEGAQGAGNILGGVLGGIQGILGGGGGQQIEPVYVEPEKSWIQKNWPLLAIGGVVVIGGILLTRKK